MLIEDLLSVKHALGALQGLADLIEGSVGIVLIAF